MRDAVQVYPRRKSLAKTTGSSDYLRGAKNTIVKPSSREPLSIDRATILPYAGLSQKLAAAYLGLSLTALSKRGHQRSSFGPTPVQDVARYPSVNASRR